MTDGRLNEALLSDERIPREQVILWINDAQGLSTLSKLYRLTREGCYRIHPDLGSEVTCTLIQRYLLECIRQNITEDDEIEDRWEAAATLHQWFCHLAEMEDTSAILKKASHALTELFLVSGQDIQMAIEQGFLEHALEMAALRPYFEHWSSNARLRAAWERALAWGEAHPGYTWRLLTQRHRSDK